MVATASPAPAPPKGGRARAFKLLAKATAAIAIAFVAFMAAAHTKIGRQIMSPLYTAKCPVTKVSAADIEAARNQSALAMAGDKPAPSRLALGFDLEKTKPDAIRAWAAKHGVTCTEEREGAFFKCANVPQNALVPAFEGPPMSEVLFAFEPKNMTLVNMTAYLMHVPEEVAATRGKLVAAHLKTVLGAPEVEHGLFEAAHLTATTPSIASNTYRFSDYHASVTATRYRANQAILREHYMTGASKP